MANTTVAWLRSLNGGTSAVEHLTFFNLLQLLDEKEESKVGIPLILVLYFFGFLDAFEIVFFDIGTWKSLIKIFGCDKFLSILFGGGDVIRNGFKDIFIKVFTN